MPAKKTYTIAEAAKVKGVSRAAIHRAIIGGRLKAREKKIILSSWEISAKDLEAYKPSREHQAIGKKND